MNDSVEKNGKQETAFGGIGIAIFFICVGIVYLLPKTFPEGTLYLVAGVLILIVNLLNSFKGIEYDLLGILFAVGLIAIGSDKIFGLEIKFLPVIVIILGVISLFTHINRLRR